MYIPKHDVNFKIWSYSKTLISNTNAPFGAKNTQKSTYYNCETRPDFWHDEHLTNSYTF